MTLPQGPVVAWSLAVRVLHWALALAVLLALATHEVVRIHDWIGYGALALAALRTVLGLVGPRSMRFAAFVRAPNVAWAYARAALQARERRHLNHNPLGGWMIVALLGLSLLAGASGALYVTDAFWGLEWLGELHEGSGELFYFLVPLHVGGVLLASWRHRENLAAAMVHGRKRAPAGDDQA